MNREIIPSGQFEARIRLPGSKYIANRLVPMCALARTQSHLSNVVDNNDINTAIAGLAQLGYRIEKQQTEIQGTENQGSEEQSSEEQASEEKYGRLNIYPRKQGIVEPTEIYTAHSGTFSRFVTAIAALESQPVSIDCSAKMATRPMQELFSCLNALSVSVESGNQCLPAVIKGPILGSHCQLDASRSSQYLSALLMVAPLLEQGLIIDIDGELVSRAYVDMTINLMSRMGIKVIENEKRFCVAANQYYQGIDYLIPGDPVSATYFMGAAAIAGGKVTIEGFDFDSVQGESGFFQVLQAMGATIEIGTNQLTVHSNGELNGINVDMGGMPDAVQTLAAVACFAKGKTTISNIAHLAYKESNRIEDTADEIRKTGIKVESGRDFLVVHGGNPQAAEINTHEDHRMAMSMALLGIRTPGIKILDAQVVEKSFPDYWDYLSQIGLQSVEF